MNWLAITNYRVDGVGRGASTKAIKAALAKDDVVSKWKASAWGKKTIGREIKAGLNDFERFQFNHSKKLVCSPSLSLSLLSFTSLPFYVSNIITFT